MMKKKLVFSIVLAFLTSIGASHGMRIFLIKLPPSFLPAPLAWVLWLCTPFFPFVLAGMVLQIGISDRTVQKKMWWFVFLLGFINLSYGFITLFFACSPFNTTNVPFSGTSWGVFLPDFIVGYVLGLGVGVGIKRRRLLYGLLFGVAFVFWMRLSGQVRTYRVEFQVVEHLLSIVKPSRPIFFSYYVVLSKIIDTGLGVVLGCFSWFLLDKLKSKEREANFHI